MQTPIRVLMVEDQPDDADLILHGLRQADTTAILQVQGLQRIVQAAARP